MIKYFLLFSCIIQQTLGCSVLSFSGGGVYGAFEVGIASRLFENKTQYDLFTGVSAGSINAAYLSTFEKGEEFDNIETYKNLWCNIKNSDVYSYELFKNGVSIYNTSPLKKTINSIFSNRKNKRPLLISATSLNTGSSHIFDENDVNNYGYTNIIMSSTAIPIAFPPYQFLNDYYVDGGITSNIVLDEAVDFCLINFPNKKINVDIIMAGKKIDEKKYISLNIINLIDRLIEIVKQQVEYSELLQNIHFIKENIIINVYEQKDNVDISMLDFSQTEELWYQGYNFTNVNVYYDILNNKEIKIKFNEKINI